MLVRIRQRDEAVMAVRLGLSHAPGSPLPRTLQAAADALTAGQLELTDEIESAALDKPHRSIGSLERRQRVIAGHGSQPDATSHRCAGHVGSLGALGRLAELARAGVLVDGLTPKRAHSFLLSTEPEP